jgi:DNA-binding LacI/PurR family transcriptional regulator
VINANVRVSPKRTEMVRAAMAAPHYQPDERGRVLRTGRSRTIGVVVPDVTNPFYPEILRDFEHAARAKGYSVLLCDSENSVEQERANLAQLAARRVDGALVACVSSRATYEWLENLALPLVFFERIPLAGRFSPSTRVRRGRASDSVRRDLGTGSPIGPTPGTCVIRKQDEYESISSQLGLLE